MCPEPSAAHPGLIGRSREYGALLDALAAARAGRGGLLLVTGEAGVGKTRLVQTALDQSQLLCLTASLNPESAAPYAPIVSVLRAYRQRAPQAYADCGALAGYLALLLPELGQPPAESDAATLFEAIRCALGSIAAQQPLAILLDDLQWADYATLELLPALAAACASQPLLLVGVYRSDEIARGHPLRRMRLDLRRRGRLHEIALEPLDQAETALLAAQALGGSPSPALAATLHHRTQGLPFFIEELAAALAAAGRVRPGPAGVELAGPHSQLVPDTVRDAVLLRAERLSPLGRQAVEAGAVAGLRFDLDLVVELAGGEAGLREAMDLGLMVEAGPQQAAFRHALTRESLYADIPWTRRRALHRALAQRLEQRGAPLAVVAEHWQAGGDLRQTRQALIRSVEQSTQVHAYRDAANAARQALDLWAEDDDESQRLALLDQLALCAQLTGELAEAARAWREVAEGERRAKNWPRLAAAQRRLASVYELQSAWEQALAARWAAAEAFTLCQRPAEAAAEQLTMATHLRSAGRFQEALDLLAQAARHAEHAQRWDLSARISGLEGNVRARMGQTAAGLAAARSGLELALAHNQMGAAAEVYQRLADSLEHAGDYVSATATYEAAFDFCQANAAAGLGQVCLACLTVVLRQTGDWERASAICRQVLAEPESPPHAQAVSYTVQGLIYALRGARVARSAQPLLLRGLALSRGIELAACELLALWGLALVDDLRADIATGREHWQQLLARWREIEDRHYAISPLRLAATRLAALSDPAGVRACASALATIATATGQPEALSALAHVLGEVALLDGDAAQAAQQFNQSLELLQDVEAPLERAETQLRAGLALLQTGQRAAGLDRLADACRAARKLGARPLAARAARELAAQGEKLDARLGRRASRSLERGGLTPRELEVLRHIAQGRTNREIAQDLFLSQRTVDMFVRSLLSKLDCRSRGQAARKAAALGWLA